MKNLRYIKRFKNYLLEQDLSDFADEGGDPSKPPVPVEQSYSFIFIDKDKDIEDGYKYPDGSFSKMYKTYKISEKDLKEWIDSALKADDMTKNENTVKSKALKEYISGKKSSISPELKKILTKFKNEVQSNMKAIPIGDTEVVISSNGEPTTYPIEITFIEV